MHDSPSTPCATTSPKYTRPFPSRSPRPATVPSRTPLETSSAAVPSPSRIPPANARNVTSMLFVKIWLETSARSEDDSPSLEPRGRGSVTEPDRPPGTRPDALPGSLQAQAPGQECGSEEETRPRGAARACALPPAASSRGHESPERATTVGASYTSDGRDRRGPRDTPRPDHRENCDGPARDRPSARYRLPSSRTRAGPSFSGRRRAARAALELLPRGAALAQKSVYVHTMEFEDVLTITTPEGVDVRLALAGVGSRSRPRSSTC